MVEGCVIYQRAFGSGSNNWSETELEMFFALETKEIRELKLIRLLLELSIGLYTIIRSHESLGGSHSGRTNRV